MLWDIIPYFEKSGMYGLVIKSLQVLVCGRMDEQQEAHVLAATALAPFLISRQARGKALERLIIEYNHTHHEGRAEQEKKQPEAIRQKTAAVMRQEAMERMVEQMALFCGQVICEAAGSASISFSAIRSHARRLKRPLSIF